MPVVAIKNDCTFTNVNPLLPSVQKTWNAIFATLSKPRTTAETTAHYAVLDAVLGGSTFETRGQKGTPCMDKKAYVKTCKIKGP